MILSSSSVLNERYSIQSVLGDVGPFDVNYLAWDLVDESEVVIREYYPLHLAKRAADGLLLEVHDARTFEYGLGAYTAEGLLLTDVKHKFFAGCKEQFKLNGTVYCVKNFVSGATLGAYLKQQKGSMPEIEALSFMEKVLQALQAMHKCNLFHGGVSPKSVLVDGAGNPVLLGSHTARYKLAKESGTLDDMLQPGFSAPEQNMGESEAGAFWDIYGCAATLYHMITGQVLPVANDRWSANKVRVELYREARLSAEMCDVLAQALAFDKNDRPANADAFLELLAQTQKVRHQLHEGDGAARYVLGGEPDLKSMDAVWQNGTDVTTARITIETDAPLDTPIGDQEPEMIAGGDGSQHLGSTTVDKGHINHNSNNGSEDDGSRASTSENKAVVVEEVKANEKSESPVEASFVEQAGTSLPENTSSENKGGVPDVVADKTPATVPLEAKSTEGEVLGIKNGRTRREQELEQLLTRMVKWQQVLIAFILSIVVIALVGVVGGVFLGPQIFSKFTQSGGEATLVVEAGPGAAAAASSINNLEQTNPQTLADTTTTPELANTLQPHLPSPPDASASDTDTPPDASVSDTDTPPDASVSDTDTPPDASARGTNTPPNTPASNTPVETDESQSDELASDTAIETPGPDTPARDGTESAIGQTPEVNEDEVTGVFFTNEELGIEAEAADSASLPENAPAGANEASRDVSDRSSMFNYYRVQADSLLNQGFAEAALQWYKNALKYKKHDLYVNSQIERISASVNQVSQETVEQDSLEARMAEVRDAAGIFILPDTPVVIEDDRKLRQSIRYPATAAQRGIEGRVIIRYMVDEFGKLQGVTVVKGLGSGTEEEVIKMLQKASFKPATFNGSPVKAWAIFSVVFRLPKNGG